MDNLSHPAKSFPFRRNGKKINLNSIFIIEAAQLCLAHVGHLHHVLTDNQTLKVGRIDILFLPIDGAYTMSY